jgi:dCTP deaminase
MMLSDDDIRRVLESRELVLSPFREDWIRGSGITLHLGAHLLRPRPGQVVDVRGGVAPEHDEILLADDAPYLLQPREFVLGHTLQSVTVGSTLGFLIEGRSTLARVGLTIVQTAMLVYPGHTDRAVTLELANHGPNPILLYPRMKIARVALFELKSPAKIRYDDSGKYRGQSVVGRPVFKNEIMPPEDIA